MRLRPLEILTAALTRCCSRAHEHAVSFVHSILFLVYTVEVSELMLNAVALDFILNIDELLFASLVPFKMKSIVLNLNNLAVPLKSVGGFDLRNGITCVSTLVLLTIVIARDVAPQVSTLVEAKDAICSGSHDFVYTIDGGGGLAWSYTNFVEGTDAAAVEAAEQEPARTWPFSNPASSGQESRFRGNFVQNTLLSVLAGDERREGRPFTSTTCPADDCFNTTRAARRGNAGFTPPLAQRPSCCLAIETRGPLEAGLFSVIAKSKESVSYAVGLWNPACADALDQVGLYLFLIQGQYSDAANPPVQQGCGDGPPCGQRHPLCLDGVCVVPTCEHARPHCGESSIHGLRARQYCPVTCGCSDPRSPLALSLPESGCGSQCHRVPSYLENLRNQPCEDVAVNDTNFPAVPRPVRLRSENMAQRLVRFGAEYRRLLPTVGLRLHPSDSMAGNCARRLPR